MNLTKSLDVSVPREHVGKSRVTIVVETKESVGKDHIYVIVVSLTGAEPAMVVVTESGERKIKYHDKVYLDDTTTSAQIITKLTAPVITTAFKSVHPLHGYTFSSPKDGIDTFVRREHAIWTHLRHRL
jgi:hypothetical protein